MIKDQGINCKTGLTEDIFIPKTEGEWVDVLETLFRCSDRRCIAAVTAYGDISRRTTTPSTNFPVADCKRDFRGKRLHRRVPKRSRHASVQHHRAMDVPITDPLHSRTAGVRYTTVKCGDCECALGGSHDRHYHTSFAGKTMSGSGPMPRLTH
ncbi:hypothetical protein EVAR_74802_1 [Eumeta japonica]|uniref:Uncharacterized protein n=1 Tax=Eumeta variegata TaxID=151549 RepID=A0A4C1SPY0_EUMVA|nr:hypothetical protein EVAR_74802_1 [Eumeta japonica]